MRFLLKDFRPRQNRFPFLIDAEALPAPAFLRARTSTEKGTDVMPSQPTNRTLSRSAS